MFDLSVDEVESLPLGIFIDLGELPQGRQHVLLLGIKPVCKNLTIVETVEHTSDCVQYLVRDNSDVVVGSVFDVRAACTTISPMHMYVTSNKEAATYAATSYIGEISHANVYLDPSDNIVVIPYSPILTSLCVDVEDDR